ncbi:MAG: hypothetical protein JW808_08320 [Victivallales bacterium]|nr:hypothetical protein [Victivallales bacterium]
MGKMEAAVDPSGSRLKVKTMVTVYNTIAPSLGLEIKTTVKDSYPDKTRNESEIEGYGTVTRVFSGGQAWEFSPMEGLRELRDAELELMKFELLAKTPSVSMLEIFDDLSIMDDGFILDGKEHVVLSGKPKSAADLGEWKFFVDKGSFLVSRIEMTMDSPEGPTSIVTIFEQYDKINGRHVPVRTRMLHGGLEFINTLDSVKENEDIDASEFGLPVR